MAAWVGYGGRSYDLDTIAWVNAVVANGGSVGQAQQVYTDTFIKSIKADANLGPNLNSVLDRLWLTGNVDADPVQTLVSVPNPLSTLPTWVGSPLSPVAGLGYTGDGTSFINSQYNPATAGGNFVQDSGSLIAGNCSAGVPTLSTYLMGSLQASGSAYISMQNALCGMILNSGTGSNAAYTNQRGIWIATRTSPSFTALYRNGNTTPVSSNSSDTSQAPSSNNIYLMCTSFLGAGSIGLTRSTLPFFGIAKGLSPTAQNSLSNYLNTYMTSLGYGFY